MSEWDFTPEEEADLRRAKQHAREGKLISQEELNNLFIQDELDHQEVIMLERKEMRRHP